ncbi:Transcriptional regulator [Providencia stuartii]|uniref:Uncharacterized protein n=1 Tax=Providencia stuartii ATCC 25827 TaxID=471874 RepID=A0AA86YQF2_PROST|nr:hypothetical protein DR96_2174 [Providencia stuartii]EDU58346.1 hypothetical protein PROSTU_01518 [Providencia stuartii ATCC 25827]SST02266.1 Uncharacterised protein [Acinetobacter baumannii]CAK6615803.1 Transcriptional regulator [Providencia stuartii]CAK6616885.1 Transcriptional regulator [Providencia stuartii]
MKIIIDIYHKSNLFILYREKIHLDYEIATLRHLNYYYGV